jgi:hypothetical protein
MSETENTEIVETFGAAETAEAPDAVETVATPVAAEPSMAAEVTDVAEAPTEAVPVDVESAYAALAGEVAAQTAAASAPETETGTGTTQAGDEILAEAKPKRRIRSTTLFTAAVVLGVLGGVGTGYGIQYSRPATPLPPLAGSQPAHAPTSVYQGVAPAMLPASQDDATLTDGDLTKLLLPVPAGASTDDSDWVDQLVDSEEIAQYCVGSQSSCLTNDYAQGVNEIADTNWSQNGFQIEIRIYRMAAGDSDNARSWAEDEADVPTTISMPTGIQGSGHEFYDTNDDNDDNAFAVHGDLVVGFWVTSPSVVPNPSLIDGLITQQMGRL